MYCVPERCGIFKFLKTILNYFIEILNNLSYLYCIFVVYFQLSGEVFHTNAQMLYQIVVFMIERGLEIFKIPAGLAADIRLYWHEKEKKKLSPKNMVLIIVSAILMCL